ncbi:MAG: Rho termination factor N-terminal domain-containing protein [Clostridia bacterium]|nr:Rho termination factor N-terminal domain-containing protein [Clostridia bacterium]
MSRENLQKKTCKELRELAKELNISGRWDMTKDQLIDAILGAEVVENTNESESAKDECKVDNQENVVEVEDKVEKESANVDVDMAQKMPYIENIEIGTLVAFRLSSGKVKSAKVTRKSTKNRKLKLETDYGAEYIVSFDDIVWVRTGKRWPRGVYKLLKGLVDDNGKEEQKG